VTEWGARAARVARALRVVGGGVWGLTPNAPLDGGCGAKWGDRLRRIAAAFASGLLRAADELHATQRFGDPTWAALRTEFTDAQLVEIPFLVGQSTMLSMVAEGLGVPPERGLPSVPPLR
jgi:hypothetical protein